MQFESSPISNQNHVPIHTRTIRKHEDVEEKEEENSKKKRKETKPYEMSYWIGTMENGGERLSTNLNHNHNPSPLNPNLMMVGFRRTRMEGSRMHARPHARSQASRSIDG